MFFCLLWVVCGCYHFTQSPRLTQTPSPPVGAHPSQSLSTNTTRQGGHSQTAGRPTQTRAGETEADALLIIRRRVVVHILPIWLDNKAGSGRRARTSPLGFSDRKVIRKSEFVNCVVIQARYLYSRQVSAETTHTPAPRLKIRFLCKLGYASKAKR